MQIILKICRLESNLHTTMTKVRNSKEYWSQIGSDLRAFDEHFGAATWFFTVSSAEYEWESLRKFLLERNNDLVGP